MPVVEAVTDVPEHSVVTSPKMAASRRITTLNPTCAASDGFELPRPATEPSHGLACGFVESSSNPCPGLTSFAHADQTNGERKHVWRSGLRGWYGWLSRSGMMLPLSGAAVPLAVRAVLWAANWPSHCRSFEPPLPLLDRRVAAGDIDASECGRALLLDKQPADAGYAGGFAEALRPLGAAGKMVIVDCSFAVSTRGGTAAARHGADRS